MSKIIHELLCEVRQAFRPRACQRIRKNHPGLRSSVQIAAFGFSQRLTADPRPRELSTAKPWNPFFFASFFHHIFWPLFSSIFGLTWPHLGRHVGPYKPMFCPSFSDHFLTSSSDPILDRFRTPNRLHNQSKINQKFVPKFDYIQALFQLPLRSNFEDNLMFKPNGRCSKNHQKHDVFVYFLNIRACQRKQTRDMKRIQE